MNNSNYTLPLIILVQAILLFSSTITSSQDLDFKEYQYISPLPGSSNINPQNNIIIRPGGNIDFSISKDLIKVSGSKSGMVDGELILSDDKQTLIFLPENPFKYGEEIMVNFKGIKSNEEKIFNQVEFIFFTKANEPNNENHKGINDLINSAESREENNYLNSIPNPAEKLKGGFPEITVNVSDNPSTGYFFISLLASNQPSYLMIIDNRGIPLFNWKTSRVVRNFHPQPDGSLTYFDHSVNKFYKMDSSYAVVDSFYCGNGFTETTDFHELILLENGHSLLTARENIIVRMDTIIAGGDSAAVVSGFVIQELDADKNVIFQWRTFDHFQITDATEDINLLAHNINPFHCNSLALDADGNLLLSSRHLDEITKINRQTGEIIWRFGGLKCQNNEFTFTNDPRTFSHQHFARRTDDDNITLLDNGNLHNQQYTRSIEYELDEINKTATLVRSFSNDPLTFTGAAGSSQKLFNNNTVIGWGISQNGFQDITEVDLNGSITYEASFPDPYTSYRALKYSWKTNLFLTDPDSIFFESVSAGDSAAISISVINNSSQSVNITGFYNNDEQYSVNHSIPFIIPPFGSEPVSITFKPTADGFFSDTLHIRSETDSTLIAQTLILTGSTDSIFTYVQNENLTSNFCLEQNYPNPFNPSTKIKYYLPVSEFVTLKVFDVLGNEIVSLVDEEKPAGNYEVEFNASGLSGGIFFYRIEAGKFIETKKLILLK